MKRHVRITKILEYTVPTFGNSHFMPYFTAEVTDGNTTKVCQSKGDVIGETQGYQYVMFNRKRYKVLNHGNMYTPNFELVEIYQKQSKRIAA